MSAADDQPHNGSQALGLILQAMNHQLADIKLRLTALETKDARGDAKVQGFKDGVNTALKLSGALVGFVVTVWTTLNILGVHL